MNKYLTLAAGATLLLGAAVGTALPANAQAAAGTTSAASGPFQDVPADHWAYSAVNTLQKAGIVIGYPDGTYGGRRAMTRYEFAEAIARLLPQINNIDTSQFAKQSDLLAFESDTDSKLATDEAAISALQALVNEFQPELTSLGTDVDALKRRLDADEDRLAAVEAEQARVKITGDINLFVRDNVNSSSSKADPLDEDGYRSGVNNLGASNPYGNTESDHSNSFWEQPNFYHDVLLTIDGKVSDTAHVYVKIDATDYGNALGSYDELAPGFGFADEDDDFRNPLDSSDFGFFDEGTDVNAPASADAFTIFRAYLDQPVNIGIDSSADLQVGRIDEQFTPFTLEAVAPDAYVQLPEDTGGNVAVDGAKINFGVGPVKVNAYAGTENSPYSLTAESPGTADVAPGSFSDVAGHTYEQDLRPGSGLVQGGILNQVSINQSAGFHATIAAPDNFTVGVTALLARVDQPFTPASDEDEDFGGNSTAIDSATGKPYDTLAIYGGNLTGDIPGVAGLGIDGEYAISQTGANSTFGSVNSTSGNVAWNGNLSYTFGPVGVKAGYEQIYRNFEAPGYWGKIGDWSNPTNVKGEVISANYSPMTTLNLTASGNILTGISNSGTQSPLGGKDDLNSFKVGADYAITSAYNVDLGYEWVQWNLKDDAGSDEELTKAGKPTEQYINLGLSHPFSANATLKLLYQIINYSDNSTGFDPAGDSEGGVAVSQLDVKF